ncbi:MFS transporter [Thioclava sp. L04-15]|uniref:MFS transporter n=1 Tax=Thioclava sp. L04-15 TaxID=1915318 RepID=UPI000998319F|nr:MFS transporter [Thioclava sp. L04-15]OOY27585.1 MFS transporter [Thioclava sp. L04-15]TNE93021.1 MAG: MFS transporter [Paracoccaceae bacterium]
MYVSIACLVGAYLLSQFYRTCLAVLTPVLNHEIGVTAGDLAVSLGLWYGAFALIQIPIGEALDRIGPRRTVGVLLGLGGGGGAAVFAMAQGPMGIHLAMILIGAGCAPVLVGSYFIFARAFAPVLFGTLAASMIGAGSLGNLAGAAPLAAAIEAFGWRPSLWALAAITLAVAALILIFARDPERVEQPAGRRGTALDVLRLPGFWVLLPLTVANYTAAAGIRGVWAGPYLADVFGADAHLIGKVTLVMGLAMIAGNFAYGPADKIFGSHKRVALYGNAVLALALTGLWLMPGQSLWLATAFLAAIGFFGASFPVIMAHGRTFYPPHLTGRGVTLHNMFSITGVAAMQFASRPVFDAASAGHTAPVAYGMLFAFFLAPVVIGLAFYVFARDSGDGLR